MASVDEVVQQAIAQNDWATAKANAQPGRWTAGWPIFPTYSGDPLAPVATPISTALKLLSDGNVDIFLRAVAAQTDTSTVGGPGGGFQQGQAPWNNFLGNNTRPMFPMFPVGGGIYVGNMWDSVSGDTDKMTGFYSALAENIFWLVQLGQQPVAYIPMITFPPGIRMDRRISTTADSVTLTTEGFGALMPDGVREFPSNMIWTGDKQVQMVAQPTLSLKAYIKTLNDQNIPLAGSLIAWEGYGSELRDLGVLM